MKTKSIIAMLAIGALAPLAVVTPVAAQDTKEAMVDAKAESLKLTVITFSGKG